MPASVSVCVCVMPQYRRRKRVDFLIIVTIITFLWPGVPSSSFFFFLYFFFLFFFCFFLRWSSSSSSSSGGSRSSLTARRHNVHSLESSLMFTFSCVPFFLWMVWPISVPFFPMNFPMKRKKKHGTKLGPYQVCVCVCVDR